MSDRDAAFQLLYYSSHPEDQEWVCVGLMVGDERVVRLEFDEALGKLRSIARDQDMQFVRTVLLELKRMGSPGEAQSAIERMGPQFKLSKPRDLIVPPGADTIERLRQRFLLRWREPRATIPVDRGIRARIETLIARSAPEFRSRLRVGPRPGQVVGSTLAQRFLIQRPVAHALVGRTRAVIFDGIDTSMGTPASSIVRTNHIAFNFWQYRNAYETGSLPPDSPQNVVRVALVFDGSPASAQLVKYASHEFSASADFTILQPDAQIDATLTSEIERVMEDQPATV